jgi:hypothetical protein
MQYRRNFVRPPLPLPGATVSLPSLWQQFEGRCSPHLSQMVELPSPLVTFVAIWLARERGGEAAHENAQRHRQLSLSRYGDRLNTQTTGTKYESRRLCAFSCSQ